MRGLRRIAVAMLSVVALAVVLWQVGGRAFTAELKSFTEDWLSRELRTRVAIAHAEISLIPLRATLEGLDVGDEGEALHVGRLTIRLLPYSSAAQLRPVVEIGADDVAVDPRAFPAGGPDDQPDEAFEPPPFRVRDLRVTNGRLLVPWEGDVLEVTVASLQGSARSGVVLRRLRAQVEAAEVVVRRAAHELRIERLQVDAAQTLRGLTVRYLEVESNDLTASVRQLRGGAGLRHEGHAELALEWLALLTEDLSGLKGRVECDAVLAGSLLDPDLDGSVAASDVALHGRTLGQFRAEVRKRGDALDVTALQGRAFGGSVTASGRLSLSDELGFVAKTGWDDLSVGGAVAAFGGQWPGANVSGGAAEAEGTLLPLSFHGRADGTLGLRKPATPVEWHVTAEFDAGGGRATVTAGQGQINRLAGEVTVGSEDRLGGVLDVSMRDTAAFTAALTERSVPGVTGRLSVAGRLSGTLGAPVFDGTVDGERLEGFGLAVDRIVGQFAADRGAVRVGSLAASVGEGKIGLTGTVALDGDGENNFTLEVSQLDTRRLLPAVRALTNAEIPLTEGVVSLRVDAREPWSRVALGGDLQLQTFQIGGEAFESLEAEGTLRWPAWDGAVRLSRAVRQDLHLSGRGSGLSEVAVTLEARDWSLEGWETPALRDVTGAVSLAAELRGSPSRLNGYVDVTGRGLARKEHRLGDLHVRADADAGRWRVDGSFLEGAVRLAGDVQSVSGLPARLRLSWNDARFTPLLGDELDADLTSSGVFVLEGRLLRPQELKGQMDVGALAITGHRRSLTASEPIRARLAESTIQIEAMHLTGEKTEVDVAGGVSLDGALDVRVRGEADLRAAEDFVEEIRSARGRLKLDVTLSRTAAGEVELAGGASLARGLLDVGLPIVFTDTEARLVFVDGGIRIETLEGRAGGGRFRLTGSIDPATGPAIGWQVTEISTGAPEWLEHEISGAGSVEGTWRDLTVAGEVQVLRVLYDRRVRLVDLIPWFKRRVPRPSAGEASEGAVRLDLHIVAPGQVFIDNNFAKIELRGDLWVRGPLDKVRLDGPIEVVTGQVLLQDRVFEITSGVIEFDPRLGLEATVHVDAETTVKTPDATYTVYAQVLGTTADYRVVLSSDDPSLSQADLASLVTLGRTTAQLQEGGGGISVNDLLLLGGGVKEDVEAGFRDVLLVDRFDIEPTFSQTTGAFEPRISVGKNLTENLSALVGTTVGAETQYRGELEYQLTRRISLLGSWESETEDQAGAFGGLVKFKYTFRRLPRFGLFRRGDQGESNAR